MLVIKAEIWPKGDVDSRFEIGRVGIINLARPGFLADYNVISLLARDQAEYTATGVIINYDRRDGWRKLAAGALTLPGGQGLREMFHPEYTKSVVDLLNRG